LSEFANDDKDALLATRYPHSKRLLTYKTTRKAKKNRRKKLDVSKKDKEDRANGIEMKAHMAHETSLCIK